MTSICTIFRERSSLLADAHLIALYFKNIGTYYLNLESNLKGDWD